MLEDVLTFTKEDIETTRSVVRLNFRQSKLIENLKAIDPTDPEFSDETHFCLKRLEEGFTAMQLVYNKLMERMDFPELAKRQTPQRLREKMQAATLYSVYVGSTIISTKLNSFLSSYDTEKARDVFHGKFEYELKSLDKVVKKFIDEQNDLLTRKQTGYPPVNLVRDGLDYSKICQTLFSAIADYCIKEKSELPEASHSKELIEIFDKFGVELFGVSVSGFSAKKEAAEQFVERVEYGEIVGNRQLIDALQRTTSYLLQFDPKTKTNVMNELGDYATRKFIVGSPGGGKTTCLKAFIYDSARQAQAQGLEFEAIMIGNDFKDKYFGESVKKLKLKLDKPKRGDKIYAIIIEDIDAVFKARDDPEASPAEKDCLHELLNNLEGVSSMDLGNCVLITTTNMVGSERNPNPIDLALLDRIRQEQIDSMGPETIDDYVKLLQIKMKKGIKNDYCKVQEWDELGKMCYVAKINGRGVTNITRAAMTDAQPLEIPKEISTLKDLRQRKQELQKLYKTVGSEELKGRITKYITDEQKNEQMMAEARVKARAKQILYEIRAQNIAQAELVKKGLPQDTESPEFTALYHKIYTKLIDDFVARAGDDLVREILTKEKEK